MNEHKKVFARPLLDKMMLATSLTIIIYAQLFLPCLLSPPFLTHAALLLCPSRVVVDGPTNRCIVCDGLVMVMGR